jgi:integrase
MRKIGVINSDINFPKSRGLTMHNDFTLFSRTIQSGKKVVYYYAYDEEGRRLGPWTTGQDNKTAARNYCNRLMRKGKLLPWNKDIPTFQEWADGFWDWEKSKYIKEQRKRKTIKQSSVDTFQVVVSATLVPYFGKMKLDAINAEAVEKWFDEMIEKKYKYTTINGYYSVLKMMIKWAVTEKILPADPLAQVKRLSTKKKKRLLITHDEFRTLFSGDWRVIWNKKFVLYAANKLAALTGMRESEVLGLRGEFVFDDHIILCAQYDKYGYRDTKTEIEHSIPITEKLAADMRELKSINGQGYLFSLDGGIKPVSCSYFYKGLKKAMNNIGITNEERKKRGISPHAWRHFCNTEMLKGGMNVKMVQAATGHKSEKSTDRYTHFNPADFGEMANIQADLLGTKGKEPKDKAVEKPALTIAKLPEQEKVS